MAIRRIVYYPDDVLTTKAPDVSDVDGDVVKLLDDMAETMYYSSGIGLAAPQVNESKRIITVDVSGPEDRGKGLLQLINPVITASEGEECTEEGCLSFPGIVAEVKRAREIELSAIDRDGKEVRFGASGLLSICLQHEIDHLDGVPFVDRLTGLKRKLVLREYAKAKRELQVAMERDNAGVVR